MEKLLNKFRKDIWNSWDTWVHLGGIAVAAIVIMILVVWLNRADYQRRLDAAALGTVTQIQKQSKAAMDKLSEIEDHLKIIDRQNKVSIDERTRLKDKVRELESK